MGSAAANNPEVLKLLQQYMPPSGGTPVGPMPIPSSPQIQPLPNAPYLPPGIMPQMQHPIDTISPEEAAINQISDPEKRLKARKDFAMKRLQRLLTGAQNGTP